jgi:hypothetical protein
MRKYGLATLTLCTGIALGAITTSMVAAAPSVGDAKFENLFLKAIVPTAEKPVLVKVRNGIVDYVAVGLTHVEDDFIILQLKSKDPAQAWVRIRDIVAVSQPVN